MQQRQCIISTPAPWLCRLTAGCLCGTGVGGASDAVRPVSAPAPPPWVCSQRARRSPGRRPSGWPRTCSVTASNSSSTSSSDSRSDAATASSGAMRYGYGAVFFFTDYLHRLRLGASPPYNNYISLPRYAQMGVQFIPRIQWNPAWRGYSSSHSSSECVMSVVNAAPLYQHVLRVSLPFLSRVWLASWRYCVNAADFPVVNLEGFMD